MSKQEPQPSGDASYVAFHTASSPAHANVVRALLEASGIPAHVEGQMLADEFAISRAMMNLQSVRVFVRGTDVERAREVLAGAAIDEDELDRQALAEPLDTVFVGTPPGAGDDAGGPSTRGGGWLWVVLSAAFALSTILFFTLWMDLRTQVGAPNPLFESEAMPNGLRLRWRDNGRPSAQYYDFQSDGIWERIDSFDREGRLASSAFDDDQDGMFERISLFDRDGRQFASSFDADGDGLMERSIDHLPNGLRYEWTDTDRDGLHDRIRIERADMTLVRELRRAGEQGFVEVGR